MALCGTQIVKNMDSDSGKPFKVELGCLRGQRGPKWVINFSYSLSCYLLPPDAGTEKAMATHSSPLAWKIPWTEEPGGQQSMGSLRVRHD